MLKYRNFGRKSLQELVDILSDMDLSFGMDVESLLTPGGDEGDEELDEQPVVTDPDFRDFAADAGVVEETEDAVETDTETEGE